VTPSPTSTTKYLSGVPQLARSSQTSCLLMRH
jgi:hypothetical protein